MLLTRCILASLFLATWLYVAITNALALYDAHRRGESTTLVLFIGGIAGALGLLVCPLPGVALWAWVPPLVDTGCVAVLVAMLAEHVHSRREGEAPPEDTSPSPSGDHRKDGS